MPLAFVDLHRQYLALKGEIDAAIAGVIATSSYIRGPGVEQFEQAFAAMVEAPHCVSCANGTDALFIALKSLGVQPGDEVITTAHSWIATSEVISLCGARVVFCDTRPDTFNLDPEAVAAKVTPRTVGIIAVHMCGQAAEMGPLTGIAQKHGLWVVEDCAQAHLATWEERKVGTWGDMAAFSFYPSKNLGAYGDAGCVVTSRADLATFANRFAQHGGKGIHEIEGINSRMDGLQAAILNVKLPHLPSWTERRRELAARYDALLEGVEGVIRPVVHPACKHVYHLYMIRAQQRDALRQWLQERGIPTVINYSRALPFYPAYADLGHRAEDFPHAVANQGCILSLPIFPEMTEEEVGLVADAVREFYARQD